MGHSLHCKSFGGKLLLTLLLPCDKEAFDAFAKEAKKIKNEKGETIVNHDEKIALVFHRGTTDLVKADGTKMVVYQNAYYGVHDVFDLKTLTPVAQIACDDVETAATDEGDWAEATTGSVADAGSAQG